MFGVAAGLSLRGYTPFVHTMSAFVTRRALDQLYISCAYQKNTINIFGSDPGFCSGFDGGSHSCFEDLAVMRTIPGAIVCDPCDQVQLDWMVRECASRRDGAIHYILSLIHIWTFFVKSAPAGQQSPIPLLHLSGCCQ